ncbi:MAG TPA: ATP-binding protein [Gemmataceae bacterium]|nr:ATP-binding protein [Gemmataceae bacterium]
MNLDPQLLRLEQHIEVGLVIQRDAGILIDRWAQRAVHEQPNAARAHHQALLDHLPRLLQTLGQGLADRLDPQSAPHEAPAQEHGEQRWEVGWSLPEVVRDYQILRLALFEHLEERLDRRLGFRESRAIDLALDEAISVSVAAYVAQSEAALREQAAALKEADQRKTDFMAILAHELRNPLAPILTSIELLRLLGSKDSNINQAREIMDRQVRQMVRLVDDLLDLTRIARGRLELRRTIVDVNQVVSQAVQTVRPLLEAQGHQLSVELPAEPIYLDADETRIVQVLVNLLSNAGKYTERGGRIRLSVSLDRRDAGPTGDEAVLRVGDNGLGIEVEMLGRIFELFTQIGRSLDRAQGGLGIGLMLVRQLVELHGGRVSAHSEGPGKGSEFVVHLPIVSPPAASDPPGASSQTYPSPSDPACHILIIEDNTDARETLALLLRMLGHRVETAATGPDGVSLALSARPQVVLIDLGLPGLDGFEVARQIRSKLGTGVRLIALTGYAQEEDRRRTQSAGFDAHLPKPVELQELNHVLSGGTKDDSALVSGREKSD